MTTPAGGAPADPDSSSSPPGAPTGTPPGPDPDARADNSARRFELGAAIILGIAAILTALSAYKAALLDGDALQGYTQSTRILNDSNTFYSQSNQTFTQDQQLFVTYAAAQQEGNDDLAEYLKGQVMRPELAKAVDWWNETDDALTPFDDTEGNPYTLEDTEEAQRLEKEASATFADAAKADDDGDKFELASVLLAITLFLAGISTLFKRRPSKIAMLASSTVSLAVGAAAVVVAFMA